MSSSEKVTLGVILCLALVTGVLAGSLYEGNRVVDARPHNPEFGARWLVEKKSGSALYTFNKENVSGKADKLGLEPFYVETNSEGMRDSEIDENSDVRVLVLGTSTTFGYGVSREETFVERTESALNERLEEEISVLNAGSPGYGMKDFYKYLKLRGLDYNPDIVVVASNNIVWRSRRQAGQLTRNATKYVRSKYPNISRSEEAVMVRERTRELIKQKARPPWNDTGMKFIYKIENITDRKEIPLVYYSISGLNHPRQRQYVEKWARQTDSKLVYSPQEYRSEDHSNSQWDAHPDSEGHRIIAQKLAATLNEEIRSIDNTTKQ